MTLPKVVLRIIYRINDEMREGDIMDEKWLDEEAYLDEIEEEEERIRQEEQAAEDEYYYEQQEIEEELGTDDYFDDY